MEDPDYFKRVAREFDVEGDIRAAVWTAQWFVDNKIYTLEDMLVELKITKEQWNKYRRLPES